MGSTLRCRRYIFLLLSGLHLEAVHGVPGFGNVQLVVIVAHFRTLLCGFGKQALSEGRALFLSVVPVFPLWDFVWEGLCGRNGKERLCRRILKTSGFQIFCLLPLYVSQILQETELLRASCFPVWSRVQSIRNCLPYPGSIPWSMKKTRRESKNQFRNRKNAGLYWGSML